MLCIAIGVITLIRDGGDIGAGLDIIKNAAYEGAANGEQLRVQDPTGLFLVYHMPVSCPVVRKLYSSTWFNNKKKELNYGIIGGTVAVCVAIAVVMFAQISNINTPMIGSSDTFVWNADIQI